MCQELWICDFYQSEIHMDMCSSDEQIYWNVVFWFYVMDFSPNIKNTWYYVVSAGMMVDLYLTEHDFNNASMKAELYIFYLTASMNYAALLYSRTT